MNSLNRLTVRVGLGADEPPEAPELPELPDDGVGVVSPLKRRRIERIASWGGMKNSVSYFAKAAEMFA